VFFSWEMETDTQGFHNKGFLKDCINKVINEIERMKMLKDIKLNLVEGLSDSSGHPIVSEEMMRQVKACHIFVGDLTVTQKLGERTQKEIERNETFLRQTPNANVLIEYAIALNKTENFYQQTVLLMNTVNGDVNDNPDLIPFDLRGRRYPITFRLENDDRDAKQKAEKELMPSLIKGLVDAANAARDYAKLKYHPFVSWNEHAGNNEFSGYFEWVESLASLRDELTSTERSIRLIGLSGMGKTRMVLESFRGRPESNHYLYCDVLREDIDKVYGAARTIFKDYPEAMLVVDNSTIDIHRVLDGLRRAANGRHRLITIYNDPTENKDWSCKYLEMPNSLDEVVDRLLDRYQDMNQAQTEKLQIKKFAGGNPMIAELLVNGLRKGRIFGRIDDEVLMNKLLGCEEGSEERQILRALSLFRDIRFNDIEETHPELDAIAHNKGLIVSPLDKDALSAKMVATIMQYMQRSLIEKRGENIGVRPLTLALSLIAEWIRRGNTGILKKLISDLLQSPYAPMLIRGFCKQIKLMDKDEQLGAMIEQLLDTRNQFVDSVLLKSEVGSVLIEAFAQVRPEAAVNTLTYLFAGMDQRELASIGEARTNIVSMMATLCYDKRTFIQAVPLLLRMAVTEPEDGVTLRVRTTAMADFLQLFNIPLGTTEAKLQERLVFIRKYIDEKEYRTIILYAIRKALSFFHIAYATDAARQGTRVMQRYEPSSDEMKVYLKQCLLLLMEVMEKHDDRFDIAREVLEMQYRDLCEIGVANLVLPCLQRAIETSEYDWETLLDNMRMYQEDMVRVLAPDELSHYNSMINSLNKSDFVFRFRRAEKEILQRSPRKGLHQQQKDQAAKYAQLAVEYVDKHIGDKDLLKKLYEADVQTTSPFGGEVARRIGDYRRKSFITDSIELMNQIEKPKYGILADFVGELTDLEFEDVALDLLELRNPVCRFAVIGRCCKSFDHWIIEILFADVESGDVDAENFIYLWSNFRLDLMKDEDLSRWLKRLNSMPNGKQASLHILQSVVSWEIRERMPLVIAVAEELTITFEQEPVALMANYQYWNVTRELLESSHNGTLAQVAHRHLLAYIKTIDGFVINNYELKTTYKLLIREYFNDIWDDLSRALLSEGNNQWTFYQLNDILGTNLMSVYREQGILFEENHYEKLLAWCKEHPELAPARLVEMAPVHDGDEFSSIIIMMLMEFGNQQEVLDKISYRIACSYEFTPSVLSIKHQIKQLEEVKGVVDNQQVKDWIGRTVETLRLKIKE